MLSHMSLNSLVPIQNWYHEHLDGIISGAIGLGLVGTLVMLGISENYTNHHGWPASESHYAATTITGTTHTPV